MGGFTTVTLPFAPPTIRHVLLMRPVPRLKWPGRCCHVGRCAAAAALLAALIDGDALLCDADGAAAVAKDRGERTSGTAGEAALSGDKGVPRAPAASLFAALLRRLARTFASILPTMEFDRLSDMFAFGKEVVEDSRGETEAPNTKPPAGALVASADAAARNGFVAWPAAPVAMRFPIVAGPPNTMEGPPLPLPKGPPG